MMKKKIVSDIFIKERRRPTTTRTETRFPYTTLFRSDAARRFSRPGCWRRLRKCRAPRVRRHSPARHRRSRRCVPAADPAAARSEEHTSELQSLMRISYAVFCLKKKIIIYIITNLLFTFPYILYLTLSLFFFRLS